MDYHSTDRSHVGLWRGILSGVSAGEAGAVKCPVEASWKRHWPSIDPFCRVNKKAVRPTRAPDRTPDPVWRFVESEIGRERLTVQPFQSLAGWPCSFRPSFCGFSE